MMRLLRWFLDRPIQMATIGALVMVFGIFVKYFVYPTVLYLVSTHLFYLYPGSQSWEGWNDTPVPITCNVGIFNVTNPNEIRDFGAKPKLQEVGTYVFTEKWKKDNLVINEDKTLTYLDRRVFLFEPSLSQGSMDDVVTVINIPLLEIASRASLLVDWRLTSHFLNVILESYRQDLFVTKTVREILFDGYHDPLLTHGQLFTSDQFLTDGKFSYLGIMNNTQYGPITVRSGEDDIFDRARALKYKGRKTWPDWNDKYCSMINGTDGTIFPPFLSRSDRPYIFVKELHRSIQLEYVEDSTFKGIDLYRFKMSDMTAAHPKDYPENECYCKQSYTDKCLPSGLMDSYPCFGSQVFYSEPHFYGCDESLLQGVEGLSPDKEKHMSYVDIQPDLGYPVRARRAIQFSFELKPYPNLNLLRHVPHAILPLVTVSEVIVLTDDLIRSIKLQHMLPKHFVEAVFWLCQLAGAAMILIALMSWKDHTRFGKSAVYGEYFNLDIVHIAVLKRLQIS